MRKIIGQQKHFTHMGRWKRARAMTTCTNVEVGFLTTSTLSGEEVWGPSALGKQRAGQGRAGPLAGAGGGVGQLTLCRWLNSTWMGCVIIYFVPRREDMVWQQRGGGGHVVKGTRTELECGSERRLC